MNRPIICGVEDISREAPTLLTIEFANRDASWDEVHISDERAFVVDLVAIDEVPIPPDVRIISSIFGPDKSGRGDVPITLVQMKSKATQERPRAIGVAGGPECRVHARVGASTKNARSDYAPLHRPIPCFLWQVFELTSASFVAFGLGKCQYIGHVASVIVSVGKGQSPTNRQFACTMGSNFASNAIIQAPGFRGVVTDLTEAKTRALLINPQLERAGWSLSDRSQVQLEVPVDGYDPTP